MDLTHLHSSGLMNAGVPAVSSSFSFSPSELSIILEMPKSAILMTPCSSTSKFCGLMSPCTMLLSWRYLRARAG